MADLPKKTRGDHQLSALKVGVAALPFVGGPAAQLLSEVLTPPYVKRWEAFSVALAQRVEDLIEQVDGLSQSSLSENDRFVTACLRALRIASLTHNQDKHDALLNAVQNTILVNPDEDISELFFSFIEDLTPTHLRILSILDGPTVPAQAPGAIDAKSYFPAIWQAIPALDGNIELTVHFMEALATRGLVRTGLGPTVTYRPSAGATGEIHAARLTTDLGRQFLSFIQQD